MIQLTGGALSAARASILERLAAAGRGRRVADIAAETGLHQNTIREHLDALADVGLADRSRSAATGRGRPAWVYTARPSMPLDGRVREYAGLAAALAGQIANGSADPRAEGLAAGERWGLELTRAAPAGATAPPGPAGSTQRQAQARHRVVAMLAELGFAPEPSAPEPSAPEPGAEATVRLTRCPLLEVAHRYREVVCAVHLGMARGLLLGCGGDAEHAVLRPFATPGACLLDLRPMGDDATGR